jgi:DNA-binding MarR family transcriptional regulator
VAQDTDASTASSPGSSRRRRRIQLGDRDIALLEFAARHRLILAAQAQAVLGLAQGGTAARLRALSEAGLLEREPSRFRGRPACFLISSVGLKTIASRLPKPRFDLAAHDHDVGLAWLDLAARMGKFGTARAVFSEREMRSHDARADRDGPPHAVRLGGYDGRGRERLHYPDLVVELASGHRIAFELELTGKDTRRREKILSGYAADRRLEAVVYLAEDPAIQRNVQASAARLGISSRVIVQRCAFPEPGRGGAGRARERSRLAFAGHGRAVAPRPAATRKSLER